MGEGTADDSNRTPSTAMLVLVTLVDAGRPLSTYEIGLRVKDDHVPPRPISIIVKSLAKDRYLKQVGKTGKRSSAWTFTERATLSLDKRSGKAAQARAALSMGSRSTVSEQAVAACLEQGDLTLSQIISRTGLTTSPVRTALRRLVLKGEASRSDGLYSIPKP